jgi:hypothetical protein
MSSFQLFWVIAPLVLNNTEKRVSSLCTESCRDSLSILELTSISYQPFCFRKLVFPPFWWQLHGLDDVSEGIKMQKDCLPMGSHPDAFGKPSSFLMKRTRGWRSVFFLPELPREAQETTLCDFFHGKSLVCHHFQGTVRPILMEERIN